MFHAVQDRFQGACKDRGLWVGGKLATQQDLSAYFFARSAERHLNRGGRIVYVMPLASLSRVDMPHFFAVDSWTKPG